MACARRGAGWLFVALLLHACTSAPDLYDPSKATPLQDPLPGKAIAYLLRSPYDPSDVTIRVDGVKVADLPKSRYTAISLAPGHHVLTTLSGDRAMAPPLDLEVGAGQRRFTYLSAPEYATVPDLRFVTVGKGVLVPIMGSRPVERPGAPQEWIFVTEERAQWFLFYTRPSAPEPGAL